MWPERFCNHEWISGPVPCPDNKPGCLVAHYGQRCAKCGGAPMTPESYDGPERRKVVRCREEFPSETAWGVSRWYRCTLPKGHVGAHKNEDAMREAIRRNAERGVSR